jgi:hypothetical protein
MLVLIQAQGSQQKGNLKRRRPKFIAIDLSTFAIRVCASLL